ncbi:hypothetical protein E4T49_03837 [Aureobasidium sp. EXF-10728]|nr:hypothetical protein E4T49_03837 [Aureobasidium sp. EXF-10728]
MNARFVDLTAHIQNQITQTFRAWGFTPPNGGIGQNQRAIAAGNWHGIAPANGVLATGGEGVVHVWCRVDPLTQRIQDRIVVKLVVAGSVRYGLPRNWANHNVGNGEPMECHLANLVQSGLGIADQQHVLSCLGWGDIEPNNWRYKLYFEYCQHSNLDGLMKIQPRRKKPGAARRGRKQFAEPFLWYLFESLAKACDAMDNTYPEGLVHQDLHPGNSEQLAEPILILNHQLTSILSLLWCCGPKQIRNVADFGSARRLTNPVVTRGLTVLDDPVLLEYAAPVRAADEDLLGSKY